MGKRSKGGQLLLILIGIFLMLILSIPKEVWILFGLIGVTLLIVKLAKPLRVATGQPLKGNHTSTSSIPSKASLSLEHREEGFKDHETRAQLDALIRESMKGLVSITTTSSDEPVSIGITLGGNTYGIPGKAPERTPDARWIRAGEMVTVQGVSFDGGMVYLGSCLPTPYHNDPCLIDPNLAVATRPTFTSTADLGYWPTYERIGSGARRTYLEWLAGGRNGQDVNIGYVFLFFYGLERRVLIDAANDEEAQKDLEPIAAEIERLLSLYGNNSHSFQRYACGLLDVLRSANVGEKLYTKAVPALPSTYELPHYIKLSLGQASKDKAPVPVDFALAWVKHQPGLYLRTAAQRCAIEFEQLFRIRYREEYGEGMILPQNRTKLKCLYHPASSGFRGQAELALPSVDLPDVTAVTGPIDSLASLVNRTTEELDAYSRLLGRTPEAKDTPAARLLLPLPLWPKAVTDRLDDITAKVSEDMLSLTVKDLLRSLDLEVVPDRRTLLQIIKHLATKGIAVEPDLENGARTPKSEDHLVLFNKPSTVGSAPDHVPYRTAQLILQLAAMVAIADGEFSEPEQRLIEQQIDTWKGLTTADRIRLHAHMKLMVIEPVTIGSLKKKIQELNDGVRETIARFMADLVSIDGVISPDEVRMLEKAYKALGLQASSVFSDLHASDPERSAPMRRSSADGFQLDPDRVRELQNESQKVSQLLSSIFTEELDATTPSEEISASDENAASEILGLDHKHAALAHLLLSRPVWARSELVDAAADLELMLDGALECINEASFDIYGQPLFDGEDPLEVDLHIIDQLRHEADYSPA